MTQIQRNPTEEPGPRRQTDVTLPRISIVVPNYNNGRTLAKTLESLIGQNYPDLQLIVVDGGSTDHSVEVIRRYEQHLDWWVSEKDSGQSDAINKGFARCDGEVVNWLCSDDYLTADALVRVGRYFAEDPTLDVLVGRSRLEFEVTGRTRLNEPTPAMIELMPCGHDIAQPSCFYRRSLLERRDPPLDPSLHYAMDFELWNFFKSQGANFRCVDDMLSICPFDGQNKSSVGGQKVIEELDMIYRRYATDERVPLVYWYRRLRLPVQKYRAAHDGHWQGKLARMVDLAIVLALAPFYGLGRVRALNWNFWFKAG